MAVYLWLALCFLAFFRLLYTRYSRGLNKFNGPFLASFTDAWKVWYAYHNSQKANDIYVDIHKRYGDVARIGPNNLSFADPQAISEIYGTKGSQQKSAMYETTAMPVKGIKSRSLLSSLDPRWHDQQRRLINPAFTLTEILKYEPWTDDTIQVFRDQIARRFADKEGPDGIFDLHQWIAFFTADVITNLTYGQRAGFLESGKDVGGIHEAVRTIFRPWLYITRMPLLDQFSFKNPLLLWLQRRGTFVVENPLQQIVHGNFRERKQIWQENRQHSSKRQTLVDYFLTVERENNDKLEVSPETNAMGIVLAGCETTAITLSSVLYFLLKHPKCYTKLQEEVDKVSKDQLGAGSEAPIISWTTAQTLPYLDACIREAMRLHPVQRMPHDRVVPRGGMVICGQHIPGGTDVGIYAPVLHRRAEVFGDDVDVYRPERWLDGPPEEIDHMKQSMFTFSYGKYNCLGKNISKMEIYKFLPSVLSMFQISRVDPESEWTLRPGAFCIPDGILVRVRRR